MKRLMDGCGSTRSRAGVIVLALLLGASGAGAQETKAKTEQGKAAEVEEGAESAVDPGSGDMLPRPAELRIENVTVAARDAATATVTFDVSWANSWRYGNFFDAAWVFFKVRGDGTNGWQHGKLSADKVMNPTGFGQDKGGRRPSSSFRKTPSA